MCACGHVHAQSMPPLVHTESYNCMVCNTVNLHQCLFIKMAMMFFYLKEDCSSFLHNYQGRGEVWLTQDRKPLGLLEVLLQQVSITTEGAD